MEKLARIGKATVDVLQLLLDAKDFEYGLAIIKETGHPSGTIYPLLDRLELAGWIYSIWEGESKRSGPRRRLYMLTKEGAVEAKKVCARAAAKAASPTLRPQVAQ